MSIYRMTDVWKYSQHKGTSLLLMLALADSADDYGVCWPGYDHLAHKTRMSRRNVIRLIDVCHNSGELWKLLRSRQRSNIYIVTIGLTREDLRIASHKALALGVRPPAGSLNLMPPPQAIEVVTRCHYLTRGGDRVSPSGDTAMSLGGDTAMSPDPSLSITILESGNAFSWDSVLSQLKLQMDRRTFDAHLLGSTAHYQDGQFVVTVRNPQSVEWLTHRLSRKVAAALAQQGHEAGVVFTWEAAQ